MECVEGRPSDSRHHHEASRSRVYGTTRVKGTSPSLAAVKPPRGEPSGCGIEFSFRSHYQIGTNLFRSHSQGSLTHQLKACLNGVDRSEGACGPDMRARAGACGP